MTNSPAGPAKGVKHFFDIGGNNGQTFDYLATLDRSYKDHVFWIFEPSPRHFAQLLDKCRHFSGEYRIRVCPFGVGGTTGVRKFREKDDPKGDSFQAWLASDHVVYDVDNGYEVFSAVVSLPEFILAHTAPDDTIVLDIDAEGSEYEILGALMACEAAWRRVVEVMVEWHHVGEAEASVTPRQFKEHCAGGQVRLVNRGDGRLLQGL